MGRKLSFFESINLMEGDTFEFGVWKGQPIEWQVLATKGGFLCISKYCLTSIRYDFYSNEWKYSELRQWLNADFYCRAFTSEEKSFLMPYQGDKVTLLSVDEVKKYLPSDSKRLATKRNGSRAWWWLRSCGNDSSSAVIVDTVGIYTAIVDADGGVNKDYVYSAPNYVRPVIYLKKDVEDFLEPEEV